MATADYFLKIDGIDGESTDAKHKGEIDVESWSWGETQTTSGGGGGGAGKVQKQDFHFVAHVTKASPKLFVACATGQHIKSALLTVRKAGETQQEFIKIRLTDLLVSSYQIGGTQVGGDAIPRDQFSLNFTKLEMTEVTPSSAGLGTPTFGGYDFRNDVIIGPSLNP